MGQKKVDGVLSWPQPKTMKDVRKFLGLANYYRRFIKDFARVARPLNMLTRKNKKWQWKEPQQKAFDELKQVFTTKLVLAAPDLDKEFRVEADASNYATGKVLSMKCSDEKWRLVAFCHKLHSVISPPNLRRFPRSQSQLKALKKTFRSMPVTSRGDQYWPRY